MHIHTHAHISPLMGKLIHLVLDKVALSGRNYSFINVSMQCVCVCKQ